MQVELLDNPGAPSGRVGKKQFIASVWRAIPIPVAQRMQETNMNRTLLMSSIAATLMVASFIASAQAPAADPVESTAPAAAQKTYTDPNDPSKGQDLVSDAKTPAVNPATVGQDKTTGNDLVAEKKDGTMLAAATERPDFQTLDVKKRGYLTADDVSSQVWLSKNFARCDASHDGQLTSQEYAQCLK